MARPMAVSSACFLLCALVSASAADSPTPASGAGSRTLQIYFIDVEGGQSTLIVTPEGHSLLIDTGWAGDGSGFRPGEPREARDANRIVAAARDAGIAQIDYLLITHFHPDHDGGVKELSELMPIKAFVDHGSISAGAATNANFKSAFDAYMLVRGSKSHLEPKAGDRLPFKDVEVTVVSSAGTTLANPMPGAGNNNATCQTSAVPAVDPYENPRSTGVVK